MNNTLKIFYRTLKRSKTKSIITIGGYSISMSVLLILLVFIIGEKSVDKGFPARQNIYRIVTSNNQPRVPTTLLNDVKDNIPGVDKICLYTLHPRVYKKGELVARTNIIATNNDFLDIFSFEFIHGSPVMALDTKENVILTQSFSEKLFGNNSPLGEMLEIDYIPYIIIGVVTDVPKNSSFEFDALINYEMGYTSKTVNNTESHILHNAFIRLHPHAGFDQVQSQMSGMISHWNAFKNIKLSLEPLSKVYFNSISNDNLHHANINMIYLLVSIAFVILIMTIFNYINITVASGYERFNEIGIKKATGAHKHDITRQIITESFLVTFFAIALAILISYALAPIFSEILDKKIEPGTIFSQPVIAISGILLFLVTGLLSGLYPALTFSGISPLQMMAHQKGFKKRGQRAGIIATQFLLTGCLIISLLTIQKQMDFIKHKDLGFNKELLVRVQLPREAMPKWRIMKNELQANPDIISVSGTNGSPMSIPSVSTGQFDISGEKQWLEIKYVDIDENFVEAFELKLIEGRSVEISDSNVCIINEHLYKKMEWENLTGKDMMGIKVIGVVSDFHYEDLYSTIGNLILRYESVDEGASVINVRINGNVSENLETIKKAYTTIEPEIPMSFHFYDDLIQSMYQKEEKQAHAIRVFTLIAIIIACLGLIGLIEHITNKKVKEIGIRKINGAMITEILIMLNKKIIMWVILAYISSYPIALYAMNRWLANFAYKTEITWWTFAISGIVTIGIAVLTVSWQSWRAATRNPVEALRYE